MSDGPGFRRQPRDWTGRIGRYGGNNKPYLGQGTAYTRRERWDFLADLGWDGVDGTDGADGADGVVTAATAATARERSLPGVDPLRWAVNGRHGPSTLLTEGFNGVGMTHDEPFADTRGSHRETWGQAA